MNNELLNLFNEQINAELYSAYLYMAMQAWLNNNGYMGASHWMHEQVEEETDHANKFMDYLLKRGEKVYFSTIEKPDEEYIDFKDVFEKILEHEKAVTESINKLMDKAIEVKDHSAISFLQWFVDEQVEEEASVNEILMKINNLERDGTKYCSIDKELGLRDED